MKITEIAEKIREVETFSGARILFIHRRLSYNTPFPISISTDGWSKSDIKSDKTYSYDSSDPGWSSVWSQYRSWLKSQNIPISPISAGVDTNQGISPIIVIAGYCYECGHIDVPKAGKYTIKDYGNNTYTVNVTESGQWYEVDNR